MTSKHTLNRGGTRSNYGMDAPGFIRGFLLGGVLLTGAGGFALSHAALWLRVAGAALCLAGGVSLVLGASMTAYGLRGKFRMRDLMLDRIAWRGDENALDIGTGLGLLLIGAAKRLTTGRATGIDIWRAEDLSGNGIANAQANAEAEGVADRITIQTADARKMEFQDDSFDVILSLLCLHNIENKTEQAAACREIARILRPGGTALIADYIPTGEYAARFAEAGLNVRESRPHFLTAYGPMWLVTASKPFA